MAVIFNVNLLFIVAKNNALGASRASDAAREKLGFNTDARDVLIDSTSRISRTARASISLIVTNHPVLPPRRRIKPHTNDSNFSH